MTGWREDTYGWKAFEDTDFYKNRRKQEEQHYENEYLFMRAVANDSIDDVIQYAENVVNTGLDTMVSRELKQLAIWLKELKSYRDKNN